MLLDLRGWVVTNGIEAETGLECERLEITLEGHGCLRVLQHMWGMDSRGLEPLKWGKM